VLFDIRYFDRHVMGADEAVVSIFPNWRRTGLTRLTDEACERAADVVWSWFEGQPTVLMHRDFQSTNLVVDRTGTVRIVDLSTLRTGFSIYDLASLAFDINLPHREEWLELIVDTFFDRLPGLDRRAFWGAAWVRLLQATATAFRYGGERTFFARAVPTSLEKLERVMREPAAAGLLAELPAEVTGQVMHLIEAR
jgi:aminoglycoside/choline kinase family phosphotransferase